MAEPLFKRLPLDNRLTPPNPIALKCSSRARVHELVLPSLPSASSKPDRKREKERDGERGREKTDRTRAHGAARSGRRGTREFIEVSLIPRG